MFRVFYLTRQSPKNLMHKYDKTRQDKPLFLAKAPMNQANRAKVLPDALARILRNELFLDQW